MKMTKKMTALALSLAMMAAGTVVSYGEAGDVGVAETLTGAGTASTNLTGTIKVTTLSVTIPTTVAFDIDMTKKPDPTDATTLDKINVQVPSGSQPTEGTYAITNNSDSPVWVYVTGVAPTQVSGSPAPLLANNYGELIGAGGNNKVMFAIKSVDADMPEVSGTTESNMKIGETSYWMMDNISSSNIYYLTDGDTTHENGKLVAKSQASASENILKLRIYAFTRKGWQAENSFTITPTFTVAVKDPTI
ncbi:MAG: hypothetical protein KHZ58_02385 [Hungatella hathewayi]|nr:hypothetical protein [Hungatella hathewayi]